MKNLTKLLCVSACLVGWLAAEPLQPVEYWKRLSADCQNMAFMLLVDRNSKPEASQFKEGIRSVERILNEMVESDILVRFDVEILESAFNDERKLRAILDPPEKLVSEYGHFVACEMVDMGFSRQFDLDRGQEARRIVRVRVPKKHAKMVRERLTSGGGRVTESD